MSSNPEAIAMAQARHEVGLVGLGGHGGGRDKVKVYFGGHDPRSCKLDMDGVQGWEENG